MPASVSTLLLILCIGLFYPLGTVWSAPKTVSFVFSDLDGHAIRLADYKGKWVLVNFWAPWCPLCVPEFPVLRRLNQRPEFVVIGVGMDYGQDASKVRGAIRRHDMDFEAHVLGGSRRDANGAFRQVGPVDFFPTSYLYSPDGEIAMYLPGQFNLNKVLTYAAKWTPGEGAAATRTAWAMDVRRFEAALGRYGQRGRKAFADWNALPGQLADAAVADQLAGLNRFINARIQSDSDKAIWGRDDYWASPAETLGKGRGDSEDLAIAKYFTLVALGVPEDRLRLVYTRRQEDGRNLADPVHLLLAYYPTGSREPLLLDSVDPEIRPASQRPDLRPVFSFNSQDVWGDAAAAVTPGASGAARLPAWHETLMRARGEGFE
jgi:predicted transglutaminase-like cysteine proteinase